MFQYVAIANTTNLYHGTSQKSKESIIISRKFYLSENEMRLDCYIINKLCEYFNYNVVVRDAYIKFSKGELGFKYPKSSIPNCTIMCVRDNKVIANMK